MTSGVYTDVRLGFGFPREQQMCRFKEISWSERRADGVTKGYSRRRLYLALSSLREQKGEDFPRYLS
jgi:hypothetical protein